MDFRGVVYFISSYDSLLQVYSPSTYHGDCRHRVDISLLRDGDFPLVDAFSHGVGLSGFDYVRKKVGSWLRFAHFS